MTELYQHMITDTCFVSFDYNNKIITLHLRYGFSNNEVNWISIVDVMRLYSLTKEIFIQRSHMDDDVPMRAHTPTDFQIVNGWKLEMTGNNKVQFNGLLTVDVPKPEVCKREHTNSRKYWEDVYKQPNIQWKRQPTGKTFSMQCSGAKEPF